MAPSPDDLAAQLERFFDSRYPADASAEAGNGSAALDPAPTARADEPEAPALETEAVRDAVASSGPATVRELGREMDELRHQLDAAFEEVIGKISRLELRLGAIRHTSEVQAEAARETDGHSIATLGLLRGLIPMIDDALAYSRERAEREPADAAVDLGPVNERLGHLDEGLTAELIESRVLIETGLDQLGQQLAELRGTPIAVDTRNLEDAANQGSLRNAAEIANLRQHVEALTEAVRFQDKGIDDLRTTLDWIKERLLLR